MKSQILTQLGNVILLCSKDFVGKKLNEMNKNEINKNLFSTLENELVLEI